MWCVGAWVHLCIHLCMWSVLTSMSSSVPSILMVTSLAVRTEVVSEGVAGWLCGGVAVVGITGEETQGTTFSQALSICLK